MKARLLVAAAATVLIGTEVPVLAEEIGVGGGPVGVTVGEGHRDRDVVRERDVLRDRDGCRDDDRGSGGVEGSDLSRATRLAIRLETSFGFGSLGLGCLADDLDNRDLPLFDRLRAAVEAIIDRAAREHRIC